MKRYFERWVRREEEEGAGGSWQSRARRWTELAPAGAPDARRPRPWPAGFEGLLVTPNRTGRWPSTRRSSRVESLRIIWPAHRRRVAWSQSCRGACSCCCCSMTCHRPELPHAKRRLVPGYMHARRRPHAARFGLIWQTRSSLPAMTAAAVASERCNDEEAARASCVLPSRDCYYMMRCRPPPTVRAWRTTPAINVGLHHRDMAPSGIDLVRSQRSRGGPPLAKRPQNLITALHCTAVGRLSVHVQRKTQSPSADRGPQQAMVTECSGAPWCHCSEDSCVEEPPACPDSHLASTRPASSSHRKRSAVRQENPPNRNGSCVWREHDTACPTVFNVFQVTSRRIPAVEGFEKVQRVQQSAVCSRMP